MPATAARSFASVPAAFRLRPRPQAGHLRRVCQACHARGLSSSPSGSDRSSRGARARSTAGPPLSRILLPYSIPATSGQQRRTFQSRDHPPPPGPFGPTENAIFSAAYAHVPEHGFSDRALALGARDAGYPDVSATVLPDGAFGLIRWHLVTRRVMLGARARELFAAAPDPAATAVDVNARAERLTWERLLANRAIIGRWQEALAIMAQPSHVPASLKELAQLADDIWFLAGDVAVDPSWYSKRASLSATYAAADLFMTNDHSPDFQDTREFLRRRFAKTSKVSGFLRGVGQWVGFTASAGLNVLRSKGARI